MKKTLFSFLLFLGFVAMVQAQEISQNAIGIRVGDNDGFGTEVNYQRALGDNNRLELGLGWRSANSFNAIRLTGCLLYTSPSPRDLSTSRMPSSA